MATARSTPNSIQQPYSFLLFALNEKRFSLRFFSSFLSTHIDGINFAFHTQAIAAEGKKKLQKRKIFSQILKQRG